MVIALLLLIVLLSGYKHLLAAAVNSAGGGQLKHKVVICDLFTTTCRKNKPTPCTYRILQPDDVAFGVYSGLFRFPANYSLG